MVDHVRKANTSKPCSYDKTYSLFIGIGSLFV